MANLDLESHVEFPASHLAVEFLDECMSRFIDPAKAWRALGAVALDYVGTDPKSSLTYRLRFPHRLRDPGFDERLARYQGRRVDPRTDTRTWTAIPAQNLFKQFALNDTPAREVPRTLLVVPKAAADRVLMEALIAAKGWAAFVLRVREPARQAQVFLLTAQEERPIPPALPDGQTLGAAVTGDERFFVPLGRTYPLAHWPSLLPPKVDGEWHLWLPHAGVPVYERWVTDPEQESKPLHRFVLIEELPRPPTHSVPAVADQYPIQPRLEPRRGAPPAAGGVVYRFDSTMAKADSVLLRLMDLAESGQEDPEYFSCIDPDGAQGANARIEHYVSLKEPLEDEASWPELRRFDRPAELVRRDLRFFIEATQKLVPNLDDLVRGRDPDEVHELVGQLVGCPPAGPYFDPTDKRQIALIARPASGTAGHWDARVLTDGAPLCRVIRLVEPKANRAAVRPVIGQARLDLGADWKLCERNWVAAGTSTAEVVAAAGEPLFDALEASVAEVTAAAGQVQGRLDAARAALRQTSNLLSEVTGNFADYLKRMNEHVQKATDGRQTWIDTAKRDQVVAALNGMAAQLNTLLDRTIEEVASATGQVRRALRRLGWRQRVLGKRLLSLEAETRRLEQLQTVVEQTVESAYAAIKNRKQRLTERSAALKKRAQECAKVFPARSARLDGVERVLDVRQADLDRQQRALEARDAALTSRENGLNARAAALSAWVSGLDSRESDLKDRTLELNTKERDLDRRREDLDRKEGALKRRRERLDLKERDLNAREVASTWGALVPDPYPARPAPQPSPPPNPPLVPTGEAHPRPLPESGPAADTGGDPPRPSGLLRWSSRLFGGDGGRHS